MIVMALLTSPEVLIAPPDSVPDQPLPDQVEPLVSLTVRTGLMVEPEATLAPTHGLNHPGPVVHRVGLPPFWTVQNDRGRPIISVVGNTTEGTAGRLDGGGGA